MTFMTYQEIRRMAVKNNIKYANKLSKKELVKALNLDEEVLYRQTGKEVFVINIDTQVRVKYKSIYSCSKLLGKRPGSIHYFLNCGKEFMDKDGNKVRVTSA